MKSWASSTWLGVGRRQQVVRAVLAVALVGGLVWALPCGAQVRTAATTAPMRRRSIRSSAPASASCARAIARRRCACRGSAAASERSTSIASAW